MLCIYTDGNGLQRPVAMKKLKPFLKSAKDLEDFVKEANLSKKLKHRCRRGGGRGPCKMHACGLCVPERHVPMAPGGAPTRDAIVCADTSLSKEST